MNNTEKIVELSSLIYDALPPLIGDSCVYVDLPYYPNIGDVLIWKGTVSFFKKYGIKVIYNGSWDTFDFREIPENVPIVMQGGGNFGDVWDSPQSFRKRVIQRYPKNKIIILPQTIFYENKENLLADSILFAKHPNITICARDKVSYEIAKKYFTNNVLCLPDMAFCINVNSLARHLSTVKHKKQLFLKRTDKELGNQKYFDVVPKEAEIRDWPTYEDRGESMYRFRWLQDRYTRLKGLGLERLLDLYAQKIMMPKMIKIGVEFINRYSYVYTTRLHTAILSVLLDIPCTFFDNSYGKNKSFYDTWLFDLNTIKFIDE